MPPLLSYITYTYSAMHHRTISDLVHFRGSFVTPGQANSFELLSEKNYQETGFTPVPSGPVLTQHTFHILIGNRSQGIPAIVYYRPPNSNNGYIFTFGRLGNPSQMDWMFDHLFIFPVEIDEEDSGLPYAVHELKMLFETSREVSPIDVFLVMAMSGDVIPHQTNYFKADMDKPYVDVNVPFPDLMEDAVVNITALVDALLARITQAETEALLYHRRN